MKNRVNVVMDIGAKWMDLDSGSSGGEFVEEVVTLPP